MTAAHAQFVELLRDREAGHALLDQKGGDATRAQFGVALGIHHQRVGVRAVGDPHLAAVEQVKAALVFGFERHAQHIAARAGFAHGQGADMLTRDQLGQVFLPLLQAAVALDLVHAQVAVGTVAQGHRGRGAGDLFHRHHVRQVAHVGATVFLADGDAQQAQVAHLAPQVHRELVVFVNGGGARRDLALRKFVHGVAQRINVFTELKVKSGQVHFCLRWVELMVWRRCGWPLVSCCWRPAGRGPRAGAP